jgi:hypothetical protein
MSVQHFYSQKIAAFGSSNKRSNTPEGAVEGCALCFKAPAARPDHPD